MYLVIFWSLLSLSLLHKGATKRPYPPKQQDTAQARRQWSVNSRFWFSLAVEYRIYKSVRDSSAD